MWLGKRLRAKRKHPKTKAPAAPRDELLDAGIGYSDVLGIAVDWRVERIGGTYVWSWKAIDQKHAESVGVPLSDVSEGFPSEEEAAASLEAELGLLPMPKPPAGQDGGIPPLPPPAVLPGGTVTLPLPDLSGFGEVPLAPLFPMEVYPASANQSELPPMTNMAGFVTSPDCNIAGVGPQWWDQVGERVEELVGSGVHDEQELMSILAEEWFPMSEIHLCQGPALIYNELTGRVRDYLEETLG